MVIWCQTYAKGPVREWVWKPHCCHRQDSTYHNLCYTSCGALAAMRKGGRGGREREVGMEGGRERDVERERARAGGRERER